MFNKNNAQDIGGSKKASLFVWVIYRVNCKNKIASVYKV